MKLTLLRNLEGIACPLEWESGMLGDKVRTGDGVFSLIELGRDPAGEM